jgi:hypothetical protein
MSSKDAVFWKSTIGIANFALGGLPTVVLTIGVILLIASIIFKLRNGDRREYEYDSMSDGSYGSSSVISEVLPGGIRESINSRNSELVIFEQNRTTEGDDDVFERSENLAENITGEDRFQQSQGIHETKKDEQINGVNDSNPIDQSPVNSHSK